MGLRLLPAARMRRPIASCARLEGCHEIRRLCVRIVCAASVACLLLLGSSFIPAAADAATIVALGASNTFGKGVARNQAYPAQLEAILRARGHDVRVINAGIKAATTDGMMRRVDR